jgi:hypothetical protein
LNTTLSVTLAPGQSKILTLSDESSNQGGWNNPGSGADNGIQASFVGLINGSEAVNLSVYDMDIHSGSSRTNPFGVTLDNYILQGGDPFGRDTGDGFEESQASGTFTFSEAPSSVPEPASLTLFGISVACMVGYSWKKKRKVAAA